MTKLFLLSINTSKYSNIKQIVLYTVCGLRNTDIKQADAIYLENNGRFFACYYSITFLGAMKVEL